MYLSKCKNSPGTKVLFISKFELVFLVSVCSTLYSEQVTLLYRFAKLKLKRVLVFCEIIF